MKIAIISLLLIGHAAALSEDAKPEPGKQAPQVYSYAKPDGSKANMSYWLRLPLADANPAGQKRPLLLFLHGSGERGSNLDLVKKHGPPQLEGKFSELDRCIVVSPQCPAQQWWDTKVLKGLCDEVVAAQQADPDRIYLTGLSMGGFATWSLLAEYPGFWAAAIPICGGGEPGTAQKFKSVPVWVFHGAKDPAVPIKASEEMIAALKKAGASPKFTVYPDEAHQSWIPAYNNPETWKWLLAQKRVSAPAAEKSAEKK